MCSSSCVIKRNASEGRKCKGVSGSEGLREVGGHTVIETSIWWCEGGRALGVEMSQERERGRKNE